MVDKMKLTLETDDPVKLKKIIDTWHQLNNPGQTNITTDKEENNK